MNKIINFNWWNTQDKNDTIPEEHEEELLTGAIFRIKEMVEQGFTSGELHEEFDDKDRANWHWVYQGYWSITDSPSK